MKFEYSIFLIISLCGIFHKVSAEYCYYVEAIKGKDSHINCAILETYEELEGISLIHINYDTTIPILKKALFSPFKHLKTLYITAANVESIEPGAFDGFNLEMVDLAQNKLKSIKNGTFNSLSTLKYLDLSHNKLESLKVYAFTGLTSLEWLSLNSNKLEIINKGTFNQMKNLRALYLHSNDISELYVETFENLVYLELVDLSFNSLLSIEYGLFTDQRNMQTLFLQHNQLEDLPNHVFDNATALKMLDISENYIIELQENLFHRTNMLEVLKLDSNKVSEFNSTSLVSHTPNLKEVYLFNNPWKCDNLKETVEGFEKNKVFLASDTNIHADNIHGINCLYD